MTLSRVECSVQCTRRLWYVNVIRKYVNVISLTVVHGSVRLSWITHWCMPRNFAAFIYINNNRIEINIQIMIPEID